MRVPDLSYLSVIRENPGMSYEPGPTLAGFVYGEHPRQLARCPNQVGKA